MARRSLQELKGYKHQENGLVVFYTGYGKGKTTAAMGVAIRAAGYGYPVKIVQFIKGEWPNGEKNFIKKIAETAIDGIGAIDFEDTGKGFVKILKDDKPFEDHVAAAEYGMKQVIDAMTSGEYHVVVADELVTAIEEKLLTQDQVLEVIAAKPEKVTLVMTGHKKYPRIIAKCDLVSEMSKIKHPFEKGILAKKGIDF